MLNLHLREGLRFPAGLELARTAGCQTSYPCYIDDKPSWNSPQFKEQRQYQYNKIRSASNEAKVVLNT
jgi:hypothetical protein